MFIALVRFPSLKPGKEEEFLEWFSWSNDQLRPMKGFVARRLLKPGDGGNYVSIVEYESREGFIAMQASAAHTEAGRRVTPLLDGGPSPEFYEVIAE
ncbi:MAG TPA: antibiotic biosynthesis monooxygenase [Syntrophorhabdaceae bacterium]|jgi:heme-degrading monooxygenase HmoA